MIFERKAFTNLYWNMQTGEPLTKGIYSTEEKASSSIVDDPNLVYQTTIPCHIQWEFKGVFIKEKKEQKK